MLAVFLLGTAVSAMAGCGPAFFCILATAWLTLAAIVGLRGVLGAGCVFVLVAVGIVPMIDLSQRGPGSLG